jgi:hypothetical protein
VATGRGKLQLLHGGGSERNFSNFCLVCSLILLDNLLRMHVLLQDMETRYRSRHFVGIGYESTTIQSGISLSPLCYFSRKFYVALNEELEEYYEW